MKPTPVLLTTLLLLAPPGAHAKEPAAIAPPSPEATQALRRIETVAVLPPRVSVQYVTFDGENDGLPRTEANITKGLATHLERIVGQRNFTPRKRPAGLSEEQSRELEFELEQLYAALGAQNRAAAEKEEDRQAALPASVGMAANAVANRFGADALLLSTYSGFRKSSGSRAKDSFTNAWRPPAFAQVSAYEGGSLKLVLIDGATGQVLWWGSATNQKFSLPPGARFRQKPPPRTPADATNVAVRTFPAREGTQATPAPAEAEEERSDTAESDKAPQAAPGK